MGRVVLQLAPQAVDGDAHGVVAAGVVEAPHLLHQLARADDRPGVGHQVLQHAELGHRQVEGLPPLRRGVLRGVELQGADPQQGGGGRRGGPPPAPGVAEPGADAGQQLVVAEGLGDVVVRPQLEPPQLVPLGGSSP